MAGRIINCKVTDEYVLGDGIIVGAAGSHKDVIIRLEFGEMWHGTTKTVVWLNAYGENPTFTILTTNLLERGETEIYLVPIPAEAKEFPGTIMMTIKGVTVEGQIQKSATLNAVANFTILESRWGEEPEDINATLAEQLQAEVDDIKDKITILDDQIDETKEYAEKAISSAAQASISEENAAESAASASSSSEIALDARKAAESARNGAKIAQMLAEQARDSAISAKEFAETSEENAKIYSDDAFSQAQLAKNYSDTASDQAELAKNYSNSSAANASNAEKYAEQAEISMQNTLNALGAMTVSSETISYESEATVERQGTPEEVHLHFGIPEGKPGEGFKILDHYDTENDLKAEHLDAKPGEAYSVGTSYPYDVYVYGKTSGWVNMGQIYGPSGKDGLTTSVNGVEQVNGEITLTLENFGVTATAAELNKLDGVTATTQELNYVDGVTSPIQGQLDLKATRKRVFPTTTSSSAFSYLVAQNADESYYGGIGVLSKNGQGQYYYIGWGADAWDAATGLAIGADRFTYQGNAIYHKGNPPSLTDLGLTATAAELNKLDGVTATTRELNYVDGVTSSIQTQLNGKAASSHTHGASSITAGTFGATGVKAATGTDYTTARVRNIQASTTDLTAGSSALANGTIYLVYE